MAAPFLTLDPAGISNPVSSYLLLSDDARDEMPLLRAQVQGRYLRQMAEVFQHVYTGNIKRAGVIAEGLNTIVPSYVGNFVDFSPGLL